MKLVGHSGTYARIGEPPSLDQPIPPVAPIDDTGVGAVVGSFECLRRRACRAYLSWLWLL